MGKTAQTAASQAGTKRRLHKRLPVAIPNLKSAPGRAGLGTQESWKRQAARMQVTKRLKSEGK